MQDYYGANIDAYEVGSAVLDTGHVETVVPLAEPDRSYVVGLPVVVNVFGRRRITVASVASSIGPQVPVKSDQTALEAVLAYYGKEV